MGSGVARRLASEGHQVFVLSRTVGNIAGTANITHIEYNAIIDEVPVGSLPGTIDGLAYCPGSLNLRAFRSLKPEVFREDFEVNVVGAVRAIQALLPALTARTAASVVLFSTVAVGQGMNFHASIAASKGAIEGLMRSLAAELAPKVRVNCIAPALTQTSLTERFFSDPEKAKALGEKYPLGRTGTIDDLASLAHFLLTPQSSWITGQVIGVDGGMAAVRR
jgi:NAD(P)-dependent dehydrogenase (short-subunit alcohol dehydrogenase family)